MEPVVTVTRSRSVLQHINATLRGQRFEMAGGYRPGLVVELDEEKWIELGRPEEITITIAPGDTLNEAS